MFLMKSFVSLIILLTLSCGKSSELHNELIIYTPHPIEFVDPIVAEFEKETGIIVEIVRGGTGELLSKIEQEQDNGMLKGDLLWGGSLATLQGKKELFEPYISKNEESLRYKNTSGYITRFTLVPSVIMINTNLTEEERISSYQDLLREEYRGEVAFANPLYSASSYEHILNQLWAMGEGDPEDGWQYVQQFIEQLDGNLLNNSSEVYKGVAEGRYRIGLTFEEAAAQYVANGFPVVIVYPSEGVILRPDGIAVIQDANNTENAKSFIDFATNYNTQSFIGSHLHRRPIRNDVEKSKTLTDFDELYVIEDNIQWSSNKKDEIIEKFLFSYERNLREE